MKQNSEKQKHWLPIVVSLVFAILLLGVYFFSLTWPASVLRQDVLTEKLELEGRLETLQAQVAALPSDDEIPAGDDLDDDHHDLEEQWPAETWDLHFTQLINEMERAFAVIFSDISYQGFSENTQGQGSESGVVVSQFGVSVVVEGTLSSISDTLDFLYELPNTFTVTNWELSPKGTADLDTTSDRAPYNLRLQGHITLVE